jgi:Domain of unknown function (DUF4386)
MTQNRMADSSTDRTQRIYARLAGFLFLWLIATGLAGMIIESRIVGSGTFLEKAQRVAASEHLYRLAITSELIETLSALLLAFALYVTLKSVNRTLAQLAMYWRMVEALIGCVGVVFGIARLKLYVSAASASAGRTDQLEALSEFTRFAGSGTFTIGVLSFSIGSLLFFYLFYRSAYIPRMLSGFGVFASVVVIVMAIGGLVFPEYNGKLQYGWAPMFIAEVTTGFWLMFAAKIPSFREQPSSRPEIVHA